MAGWEYKVVPAPTKGQKGKGVKGAEARFALALETMMNDLAAEGWEFQRAETLPSVERSGLTGSTTEWRNLLVFRRASGDAMDGFEPELLPPPSDMPEVDEPDLPSENGDVKVTEEATEKDRNSASLNQVQGATSRSEPTAQQPASGIDSSLRKLASERAAAQSKD